MVRSPAPPLRVAYLVSRYPAVSHTFILREVRLLDAEGVDVHVASINGPDRPAAALTAEELEETEQTWYVKRAGALGAVRAHLTTLVVSPFAYLRGLFAAIRLAGVSAPALLKHLGYFVEAVMVGEWMQRGSLTHLHVHFATPAATVGLIAARTFPIDFSMTVHGPDEFDDVRGYHLREKVEAARFVCCIGKYARSQMMRLVPRSEWPKFEVAPLGVDPSAFAPRPAAVPGQPFEVLCVGRLVPAKGQAILIGAIAQLVRAGRSVRLRLVGDGPDRAALERDVAARGLQTHVLFDGALNADAVRVRYAQADAFALASFAEGIPVVLMEAMSLEIPVVATTITGIPELIRPGIDGLLVPPSDEDAMAQALMTLMDDPQIAGFLTRSARQRILNRFNIGPNVAHLARVFRRRVRVHGPVVKSVPALVPSLAEKRS